MWNKKRNIIKSKKIKEIGNRIMKLKIANQVRRLRATKNMWILIGFMDKNPGLTVYDMAKKMKWPTGKVDYYVKRLLKDGLIRKTTEIVNGRTHIYYYPKDWKEFINWDEMTHTKRPRNI